MRTKDGINLANYKTCFGSDLLVEKRQIIEALIKNNLLELKNGSICPTLSGMAVADSLALI
jgi:coproporphyrinogen III oxidase-like Fe-S oxidoreductase